MRRVLVVDDDGLVLDAIRAAFPQRGGFQVDCAEDGETGLSGLAVGKFDLALIDYGLPKVPGTTVAKHALTRIIPVVLMTAYGDVITKCADQRFPILAKPFRIAQLVERFEQVVAEAKRLNEPMRRQIEGLVEAQARHQELSAEWQALCERMQSRH